MRISIVRLLGVAAAALACTGVMQAAEQGTFHLTNEIHWGKAVLEPGDYRMVLPAPGLRQPHFRIEGRSGMIFELPLTTGFQSYSDSNYLKLVKVDGNYFIQAFSSGATGKTFTFSVPKPTSRHLTSENTTFDVAVR
ncbi:MAG TPA: hypothetical protein VFA65_05420 [Bryobacteraceae bacterium]|nr:hypothetical protein [Bryobacteraceae bacterium]